MSKWISQPACYSTHTRAHTHSLGLSHAAVSESIIQALFFDLQTGMFEALAVASRSCHLDFKKKNSFHVQQ